MTLVIINVFIAIISTAYDCTRNFMSHSHVSAVDTLCTVLREAWFVSTFTGLLGIKPTESQYATSQYHEKFPKTCDDRFRALLATLLCRGKYKSHETLRYNVDTSDCLNIWHADSLLFSAPTSLVR